MQPENPPPPPPPNYPGLQPMNPPPPDSYLNYAPPPRPGTPVWVWILAACLGGGCLLVAVFAALLFPVFGQARESARATSCLSNLKQIDLGILMYTQDYDERLPIATNWQTGINPYIKNEKLFHCPSALFVTAQSAPPATNYAYNSTLDMMKMARLAEPQNTISNYDSTDVSRNANDALTSLPAPGRHRLRNNISFADGHAKYWPDAEPLPKGTILPDTH